MLLTESISMAQYEYEVHSADENVCGADKRVKGTDPLLDQIGEGIVARFFDAVRVLSNESSTAKVLRDCGIEKHNYYKKRRGDTGKCKVPVAWLSSLCENYRVSPEWLLLGSGKMIR